MRVRWLILAVAALAVGVTLLLLALDVGRWQSRLARGDLRFRAVPTRANLWHSDELVPFHAARRLLQVDDDLTYRETLQSFWLARPHASPFAGTNLDTLRSEAMVSLARYVRTANEPQRRSQAANLLGVMGLALATTDDPGQRLRFLLFASKAFRGALTVDSGNEDAKFNLELTLRLLRRQPTGTASGSAHGIGRAGGAALAPPGSGY
jgi:hypothetical protein